MDTYTHQLNECFRAPVRERGRVSHVYSNTHTPEYTHTHWYTHGNYKIRYICQVSAAVTTGRIVRANTQNTVAESRFYSHTQYTTGRIVWAKYTSHCRVIITGAFQPAYTDDGGYLLYLFTCIAFRERVCSCDMRVSGYGCVYNIFMYGYPLSVSLSLALIYIYTYTYIHTYIHVCIYI